MSARRGASTASTGMQLHSLARRSPVTASRSRRSPARPRPGCSSTASHGDRRCRLRGRGDGRPAAPRSPLATTRGAPLASTGAPRRSPGARSTLDLDPRRPRPRSDGRTTSSPRPAGAPSRPRPLHTSPSGRGCPRLAPLRGPRRDGAKNAWSPARGPRPRDGRTSRSASTYQTVVCLLQPQHIRQCHRVLLGREICSGAVYWGREICSGAVYWGAVPQCIGASRVTYSIGDVELQRRGQRG
jgi:hypothetical protein